MQKAHVKNPFWDKSFSPLFNTEAAAEFNGVKPDPSRFYNLQKRNNSPCFMPLVFHNHFLFFLTVSTGFSFAQKPNILWIYAEDTSPWMGCYGDDVNVDATPNIDAIAELGCVLTGRMFRHLFVLLPDLQ